MKKQVCFSLVLVLLLVMISPIAMAADINVTFTPDREDYVFSVNGTDGVTISVEGTEENCKYTAYASDENGVRVWSKTGGFAAKDGIKLVPYNKQIGNYDLSVSVYSGDRAFRLEQVYSLLGNTAKSDVLGIQNGNDLSNDGMVLDKSARAGMGITRIDIQWSSVEKEKGKLSLDDCTKELKYIQRATEQGMDVMAILCSGNVLYTDTVFDMPVKGTDAFDAYLEYCDYVVRALKPYGVKYFCIWNEPNNAAGQTATSVSDAQSNDPGRYADLVNAAAPVIRNANEEAVIIAGRIAGGCSGDRSYSYKGNTMSSKEYIEQLFDAGIADSFDVFAIHPYMAWEGPPDEPRLRHKDYLLPNQIDSLKSIMNKKGLDDKKIWITELGYSSNFTSEGQSTVRNLSEETKAAYNARHGIMALADGRSEKVVYHVTEYYDGFIFFENNTLIPHKTYFSVAAVNRFLNGKTAVGKIDAINSWGKNYSAYLFNDDNGENVLVLWARGDATSSVAQVSLSQMLEELSYTGAKEYGVCYDYMGNNTATISSQETISLDYKPLYIVLSDDINEVEAIRNGTTVTFNGHSMNEYIGVMATDSENELVYINQFDTADNDKYTFDTKVNGEGEFTFYIIDRERRIPFKFQFNPIEIKGIRNYGEDSYLETSAQLKDGTILVTVQADDTDMVEGLCGILALYAEDGRLLKVKLADSIQSSGVSETEMKFENMLIPDECDMVKCMLLKSLKEMEPASKSMTLE